MNLTLADKLNNWVELYNRKEFIEDDPICVPHQFNQNCDIEMAAFFASIFAWGNRKTIISKTKELMARMDNSPYDYILNHSELDLKSLLGFKHRTFNETDLLYIVYKFNHLFNEHHSIENLFFPMHSNLENAVEVGLNRFNFLMFDDEIAPHRTKKHISYPAKKAACKRLNMFLRWMVRNDGIVDFGIWKNISPSQLIIPLDVHVFRIAKMEGILNAKSANWNAAVELTQRLKIYDEADPVKYDFALFGLGAMHKKSGKLTGFDD